MVPEIFNVALSARKESMKTNPNDPSGYVQAGLEGLTKREYFAAQALVGLSAQIEYTNVNDIAETCVQYADALIKVLNKEKEV
jgi:hypothetical protein